MIITAADVSAAAERLVATYPPTALDAAPKLSTSLGCNVYLKREDLQPVHSFKIRGAYNRLAQLSDSDKKRSIIAASAGNHAQGVALSAQQLGLSATIVMPRTTPDIKVSAVRGYGAQVILKGDNFSEAFAACQTMLASDDALFVHPFDDPDVIAGQGTVAKEILDSLPTASHLFIPVGGGGLLAGMACYAKHVNPAIIVVGVEPVDSNAMQQALAAGHPVNLAAVGIFADGVAVKQAGTNTLALAQQHVDEVITVTTDQMCAAIKAMYEDTRAIVEPAGALGIAGMQAYASTHDMANTQCVAVCSGANMSFEKLQFVAERTLLGSGKEALYAVQFKEQAGTLAAFCDKALGDRNITEFCYRLQSRNQAVVLLGIKLDQPADHQIFMDNLHDHDYRFTDLTDDDTAKEHIRHMVGGDGHETETEQLYEVYFPERPGALRQFLVDLGQAYNISLFHYRGQGGDIGRVLIGFETTDKNALERALTTAAYDYRAVHSAAVRSFLGITS